MDMSILGGNKMRKVIAALQTSVDGFIEGPNGELDWAMAEDEETWRDLFEMLSHVDTCILGRVMYPGYEQYWLAVLAKPDGPLPFCGGSVLSVMLAVPANATKGVYSCP
jgi:dihydrofolate reductase